MLEDKNKYKGVLKMARKETNLPEIQWFSPYSSKNALAITIPNKMHLILIKS